MKESIRQIRSMFNEGQQEQIRLGLEKGLDVSKYADPRFTPNEMKEIRLGLQKD